MCIPKTRRGLAFHQLLHASSRSPISWNGFARIYTDRFSAKVCQFSCGASGMKTEGCVAESVVSNVGSEWAEAAASNRRIMGLSGGESLWPAASRAINPSASCSRVPEGWFNQRGVRVVGLAHRLLECHSAGLRA